MPAQLGSDYLGRLITRNGGTVQRPCPTGGLLNDYCDSDDYYAWKESEAAQASEIARKEQEIEIRGLELGAVAVGAKVVYCLLYTSPSPRDRQKSRMPSSA